MLTIACTLVLAALLTLGAPSAAQDAEVEVTDLERAQAVAVVSLDVPTLERIYADDFRFTHGTGEVQSKAEWLEDLREGRRHYDSREHETLEVEVHGDVAVTYGHLRVGREMDGVASLFLARYVRVYVRRLGRWQLVSHRTVEQRELR